MHNGNSMLLSSSMSMWISMNKAQGEGHNMPTSM